MDLSKFKPGDWLLVAGGAVMLIFGLALDWAEFDGASAGTTPSTTSSPAGSPWLLVVGAGVIAVLLAVGAINAEHDPVAVILLLGDRARHPPDAPSA